MQDTCTHNKMHNTHSLHCDCEETKAEVPCHGFDYMEPPKFCLGAVQTLVQYFTMAEILGIVAGGAGLLQLSVQLLETAKQLKSFANAMRDASDRINDLSFELETFSLSIRKLESHRQRDGQDRLVLARCIQSCQRNVAKIDRVVQKVAALVGRSRQFGKAYFAFKEQEVDGLLTALEQSKTSMMWAYQLYAAEEQQTRFDELAMMRFVHAAPVEDIVANVVLVRQELKDHGTEAPRLLAQPSLTPHQPVLSIESGHPDGRNASAKSTSSSTSLTDARRAGQQVARSRTRLTFAPWFSNHLWTLAFNCNEGLWNCTLQTWDIVRADDEIFDIVADGDIEGLQKVVRRGQVSLRTRNDGGYALIHKAAAFGQLEMCRFLLQNIAYTDPEDLRKAIAVFALRFHHDAVFNRPGSHEMFIEFYKLFTLELDPDLDVGSVSSATHWDYWFSCMSVEALDIIVQSHASQWKLLSLSNRVELAVARCKSISKQWRHFATVDVFLRTIGLLPNDPAIAQLTDHNGDSILHWVAREAAETLFRAQQHAEHTGQHAELQVEWFTLAKTLLRAGVNPSVVSPMNGETPLLRALHHVAVADLASQLRFLTEWATVVQDCGIDLVKYGQEEHELWPRCESFTNWTKCGDDLIFEHAHHILSVGVIHRSRTVVRGLVYGPSPRHWSINAQRVEYGSTILCQGPPGSWKRSYGVPNEVYWVPSEEEQDSGLWRPFRTFTAVSRTFDARERVLCPALEPFMELVEGTQDDHGCITLMALEGRTRPAQPRPRSLSTPNISSTRRLACWRAIHSENHEWLPSYHLCPNIGKYALGCREGGAASLFDDGLYHNAMSLRDCARRVQTPSLEASDSWRMDSFFSDKWLLEHTGDGSRARRREMWDMQGWWERWKHVSGTPRLA